MNETLQTIKARRSVRAYTEQQVSAEDLNLILEAGIGIMFPFTNNYKVGKERISKVAPFRSETFVRETGQMVVLRVGYTFEFGRKHKAGNKGLNNSDTDSGIINMQR